MPRHPELSRNANRSVTTAVRSWIAVAVLLAAASTRAFGYGGDTHYYLHFALGLEACYDWDEAHLIASADYLVDKNRVTSAEWHPFSKRSKVAWHAFGGDEERFNAMWERVLAEPDRALQLVKLGQFLHFVADWESHHGYGERMGHGVDTVVGRDPDSLGYDRQNNYRMIVQSLFFLFEVCEARDGAPEDEAEQAIGELMLTRGGPFVFDPRVEELFVSGSPKWRILGERGKKGKQVLANSHRLVEELIEFRSQQRPVRKLPEDFTPGDPEKGLPPPIGLRYDKNGELIEVVGVEFELLPEYDGDEMSDGEELEIEEALDTDLVNALALRIQGKEDPPLDFNVELEILDADLEDDGWTVKVKVKNLGDRASSAGELSLWVSHLATEEVLGSSVEPIPSLAGEDAIRRRVFVASNTEPTKEVMITGVLDVADLSADNNDVWFLPWRSGLAAAAGKRGKKEQTWVAGPAEIVEEPELWGLDAQGVWISVTLAAPGGDTTRRLEGTEMTLVGPGRRVPVDLNLGRPIIWFAAPEVKRRIVAARTFSWIPFDETLCAPMADPEFRPQHFELIVSGTDIEPTPNRIELDDRAAKLLRDGCESYRRARPE